MARACALTDVVLMDAGPMETGLGRYAGRHSLFFRRRRRNEILQFAVREPTLVGVAGVAESFGQRPSLHPVFTPPPRMRWLNDVAIFHFERISRFVF